MSTPHVNTARVDAARAAGYRVRPLREADIEAAARVHVQVWREAYAGLMPADYLAGLEPVAFAKRRRERLARARREGGEEVIGLDRLGRIVALASAGPARDVDPPAGWELRSLNVLAVAQGSGLADLVMAVLVGDRPTCLWVIDGNERARRFYARHGFLADGATKVHPPTGCVELRMHRR